MSHANQWSNRSRVLRGYIRALQRLAQKVGRTPYGREIMSPRWRRKVRGLPARSTWCHWWGSLAKYQAAAGLEPNKRGGRHRPFITHCKKAGHPLTPDNVYTYVLPGRVQRVCKVCHLANTRANRERRLIRNLKVVRRSATELAKTWVAPTGRRVIRFAEVAA